MKIIYRLVSEFIFVRWISISIIFIVGIIGRVCSHLRFKALVRRSGQSVCHWSVEIKYGENITIGDFSSIAQYSCLGGKSAISIGSHVRISRGVVIETAGLDNKSGVPYKHISKPISIGDGVWIASNAIILPGVSIGDNSIIGAGAVVSKDVKEGAVIVGQPVRTLSFKE